MASYNYMMSADEVAQELNCSKSYAYSLHRVNRTGHVYGSFLCPSALQGFMYRRCVPSSVLAGQIHRADPYGVRCISFACPAARTGIFTKGDL